MTRCSSNSPILNCSGIFSIMSFVMLNKSYNLILYTSTEQMFTIYFLNFSLLVIFFFTPELSMRGALSAYLKSGKLIYKIL